jgi:ABC-type multidrug transport system fused ATPase/permease subunit
MEQYYIDVNVNNIYVVIICLVIVRVLLCHQATAAVDVETDAAIQKTIREEFAYATCLTVAHRLNTILDSDKVMVMDKGRIAEYDTPQKLLANPKSMFYALVQNWESSQGDEGEEEA